VPGTSHYELLRAFADDATLLRASHELDARGYRTHEFGDSVFVERSQHGRRYLDRGGSAEFAGSDIDAGSSARLQRETRGWSSWLTSH
jgi:S-adenosylmethionine:tRNA ribosyltransferase-isomerase